MGPPVAIVRCETYEDQKVLKSLGRSIELLGGIQAFIRRGDRVLLKPNLLYGRPVEKAVTTHPAIIKGMIQIVREAGGIPFIGDSPSVGSVVRAAEKAGIKAVADESGCPLVEFDQPTSPARGARKVFKRLEIDRSVLEADVVINLPKWKTHGMMLLTLGVKNLFGCVPGPRKALWHLKAGEDRRRFAQVLLDLYQVIRPALTILDGVVGMEGNGPQSGRPISLGLILASRDPLSIDQVVCDLIGMPRKSLLTNRVALEDGIGGGDISVVGEPINQIQVETFALPSLTSVSWNLPTFLRRALKNAFSSRPAIVQENCRSCDRCTEICPPKALERKDDRLVFDYGECIRCFCCQEVCPEGAVSIEPGWVSRLVRRETRGVK